MNKIYNVAFAYGSIDLIRIIEQYKYKTYTDNLIDNDAIILIVLMIAQLKYDISGIIVDPISWMKINIKDLQLDVCRKELNKVIRENKLNKDFIVEDNK